MEKLTFKVKLTVVIKEIQEEVDWIDYMDIEAIEAMLKVAGDVLFITIEEPNDPSTFITPIDGQLSDWTWVRFTNSMGKMSCNASSNVLFNFLIR